MRIQHNIMAMNSYRNYSHNTSALSKNLEKLSSGYRINRAGDDAAGLAISEKMRAQISGLSQAQSNAKSGINLVQTAEGALTEVHDMLNRMVKLADQSANGTYDDKVDRSNLQKEVAALQKEIDRIADASNFNGIKLLDGSMDTGATAASTSWSTPAELEIGTVGTAHNATGSVLHVDGITRVEPSFTVDLTGVEFASTGNTGFTVNIGGTNLTVNTSDGTTPVAADVKVSGSNLAAAIAAAANANTTSVTGLKASDGTASATLNGIQIGNQVYKATAAGSTVKFELQTQDKTGVAIKAQTLPNDGTSVIAQSGVTFNAGVNGTLTGLDASGHANTKITAGVAAKESEMACATIDLAGKIEDGTKLTIGNKTYVFKIGADSKVEASGSEILINMSDVKTDDAQLVDKAIAKLTQQDNGGFRLESSATGKLTAVETAAYAGEGDLKTEEGLKSNFKISQMTVTAANAGDTSKALTLQIGDTSETFNKLTVSIQDMHCTALGVDLSKVDISSQEGASSAIKAIKDAINTVSSVRGDLGATQNRLEHTINNLSVMQENIQDAESTIRDVDVADEMMAYTKNNILVQSAQAMLAQANQVPQGVLQLLQ